jgi:hypothetical protein
MASVSLLGAPLGSVANTESKAAGRDDRMNQVSIPNLPTTKQWSRPTFAANVPQDAWPLRISFRIPAIKEIKGDFEMPAMDSAITIDQSSRWMSQSTYMTV